jgi:hypothetical protein
LPLARQRRLGARKLALQLFELFQDRRQIVDIVVKDEPDGTLDHALLILERNAADDELAVVELHEIEQDRASGLDHVSQLRMWQHLLDRPADGIEIVGELEQAAVAPVQPDDPGLRIDHDGAFEIFAQHVESTHGRRHQGRWRARRGESFGVHGVSPPI